MCMCMRVYGECIVVHVADIVFSLHRFVVCLDDFEFSLYMIVIRYRCYTVCIPWIYCKANLHGLFEVVALFFNGIYAYHIILVSMGTHLLCILPCAGMSPQPQFFNVHKTSPTRANHSDFSCRYD